MKEFLGEMDFCQGDLGENRSGRIQHGKNKVSIKVRTFKGTFQEGKDVKA